ncbi:uncharacterized protein LOC111639574 [Centruroides sculpturatus]|uniref:uncharacterized protein LOC111639574 n=1 Tax=Centruroides sculpturatus TaxID=218467 RepID=UPI000C6D0EDE|nr:uncharacterized protein LOC111639574 [Centruroides sculpturatus]
MVIRLLEDKLLPDHLHNIIMYKRYVDDILILWRCKPDMPPFLALFNNNPYGLTLGLEQKSYTQVHFLDVSITVKGSTINTEVYRKPLVEQLYIPVGSCDPKQYKVAAFNTLVKRAYTHSLTLYAFETEINVLKIIAERHGYSKLITTLVKKNDSSTMSRSSGNARERTEGKSVYNVQSVFGKTI